MEASTEQLSGGCLCGDVRITATGRPKRVGLCHCLDCRKHHGALFYAAAIFPEDAVTISGATRAYAPGFPRCARPVRADLRKLDRPPRSLAAAVSVGASLSA
jgi:hypothetical protein